MFVIYYFADIASIDLLYQSVDATANAFQAVNRMTKTLKANGIQKKAV